MSPKRFWKLLKLSFQAWQSDKASRLAAALAYYTAFSIAPLLLLVIAIAGFFLGQEAARGEVFAQINGLVGSEGAQAIESMLENSRDKSSNAIATIISISLLIFGASGVFFHLKDSLNTIWNVEPAAEEGGVINMIRSRLLSFSMIPVIGLLLIISLAVSALITGFSNVISGEWQDWFPLIRLLDIFVSFGVITFLFAIIFKVLPDAEVQWSDVWIGAATTSLLFGLGKWGIGLYLGNSSIGSTYGAAGSFVVLLIWIYYSAQILFFGAEFTQVYANRYGSQINPARSSNQSPTANSITQG